MYNVQMILDSALQRGRGALLALARHVSRALEESDKPQPQVTVPQAASPAKGPASSPARRMAVPKLKLVAPPICGPAPDPPVSSGAPIKTPGTVSDLLQAGCYGTAVEELERRLKRQPNNFNLLLELAQAHARHCGALKPAERIITHIETAACFTPEQKQQAARQLKAWREAQAETAFLRS